MKLSKYCIIGLTFAFTCCKSSEIFVSKALHDDAEIRGYNVDHFFKETSARKIDNYQFKISNEAKDEFIKLKKSISDFGHIDNKMGIYYYAFVHKKDTVYASSDFESWKYKNKVGVFKTVQLKKEILNSIER